MASELTDSEKLALVAIHYGMIDSMQSLKTKTMCPFHSDKNPSFLLDFTNGTWHCFGCELSGDAEKLVKMVEMKHHGLNDLAALKVYYSILKGDSGVVNLKRIVPSEAPRLNQRHLYNVAYDYYHGLSKVSWRSSEDPDVIEVRDYLKNRGFTARVLDEVGAKVTYQWNYPVVFPMRDNGKFRGWVCRTTRKEIESKRKYLYNKGFSRATTLVGDYGVFGNELDKYVIVVEGFMDRLKFVQFGVKNVVAILGWKMSTQQIEKLHAKGINTVVSALDNDECGRKGTDFLKMHFKVVRFSYLKGLKDPGDMDSIKFRKMFSRTKQKLQKVMEEEHERSSQ